MTQSDLVESDADPPAATSGSPSAIDHGLRADEGAPLVEAMAGPEGRELAPPMPKPAVYSQVVRGSVWFTIAVSISALGGLIYLPLAQRINDGNAAVVGQGSKLVALLLFINYLTGMGIPVAVARFAPSNTKAVNTLFQWGLIYTAVASFVGTLACFGAAAFLLDDQVSPLFEWGAPVGVLLFFALVTGQSFAVLVELRLVTMRRWGWVIGRVSLVVLLRLPLFMIPFFAHTPVGLFLIMVGTPALSGFVGSLALRYVPAKHDRAVLFPLPPETRMIWRYATVNWFAMLASQAPQFIFPLIVSKFVHNNEYGAFWFAWQIVNVVFLIPQSIGNTVLSEGSRAHADTERQARLGLAVAGTIMVLMTAGAFVLSGYVVQVLFHDATYDLTAQVLPRMVAAGIPWVLTAILLARARVYQQQLITITITGGFAVATLIPATLLASSGGVPGAATAWFIGNVIAALIAVGCALGTKTPADHLALQD